MALLIFDLDHTLYNSPSLNTEISKIIGEKFRKIMGLPDDIDAYDEFKKERKKLAEMGEPVSATHLFKKLGVKREEFFAMINDIDPAEHIEFDPLTQETIKKLAEEHDLVVLSNSPREKVDRVLEALDIKQFFAMIYGADDLHDSKPNSLLFHQVLAEMHYPVEEAISIGDDIHKEIIPSKEIGMRTILIKKWDYEEKELAYADHIIHSVHELPILLEKLN